jgi:hypothetical protein
VVKYQTPTEREERLEQHGWVITSRYYRELGWYATASRGMALRGEFEAPSRYEARLAAALWAEETQAVLDRHDTDRAPAMGAEAAE